MNYYAVIPAHNEELYIRDTLNSIVTQSLLPTKLVVVNDNSTDATERIIDEFVEKYSFISKVNTNTSDKHLPGSKVINAFYQGYESLDKNYDIIAKLDADLILPDNYFETICNHFTQDSSIGIAGGFCYIQKNDGWKLESLTDKDHVRGALKSYRKKCFENIGGLKKAMGWDTVDELLALYHGWNIKTDETLHVKHLKPTGANYNKQSIYKQGKAFYKLRYGLIITIISSAKLAFLKKNFIFFINYMSGYFLAMKAKETPLVTPKQGVFIRKYRRKKMMSKIRNLFFNKKM